MRFTYVMRFWLFSVPDEGVNSRLISFAPSLPILLLCLSPCCARNAPVQLSS